METKKVLLVGIDPSFIDFSHSTSGRTPQGINTTRIDVRKELNELGFEVHECIVPPDETAGVTVRNILAQHRFDSIMIGGGLRGLPQYTSLFEEIINLIHQHARFSKICFNTGPETTVTAVLRSLKQNI
jgi:hypothetical protein